MQSWTAPDLPRLPGQGVPLRLYDTAGRTLVQAASGPTARMYVCGITPYDATHLGHAATYLAFDLITRVWQDAGVTVVSVQNVTDIDDPLLERARRDDQDWMVLAMSETALFREDMEALRVIPPTHFVGVVETMGEVIEMVEKLLAGGAAYRLADGSGDIYFDTSTAPRFGEESGYDRATMLRIAAERGGDPERIGKRDPLDPLLWRAAREAEPSWPSPMGSGRPGWHVECSAIAVNRLGMRFDVQGGGSDLVFPHHEFSAAHAETATGEFPFARAYVHAGMIGLEGQKMAKSMGNLAFVSRLRGEGVDPMALRLALLGGHYRTDRSWEPSMLRAAEARLGQWRQAVSTARGPDGASVLARLRERLADDLDTPAAFAAVDHWSAEALAGGGDDGRAPALVRTAVDALLGVTL